jgi:hypothetical protein
MTQGPDPDDENITMCSLGARCLTDIGDIDALTEGREVLGCHRCRLS